MMFLLPWKGEMMEPPWRRYRGGTGVSACLGRVAMGGISDLVVVGEDMMDKSWSKGKGKRNNKTGEELK